MTAFGWLRLKGVYAVRRHLAESMGSEPLTHLAELRQEETLASGRREDLHRPMRLLSERLA